MVRNNQIYIICDACSFESPYNGPVDHTSMNFGFVIRRNCMRCDNYIVTTVSQENITAIKRHKIIKKILTKS